MRFEKIKAALPLLVLLLSGSLVASSLLSAASPGSAQDPLITESYLLLQLEQEQEARQKLEDRLAELERRLLGGTLPSGDASATAALSGDSAEKLENLEIELRLLQQRLDEWAREGNSVVPLQIVSLKPGETIFASAGTELILRSGQVRVVAPATGGLSDLTQAVDIVDGEPVALNHLLLVPRDDERGVIALDTAVLMVRGEIRYKGAEQIEATDSVEIEEEAPIVIID